MERADLEQWKSREVARLLALVETERRYWQEIVSNLPVALAVLNPQRYIVSANRTFRSKFGLRAEDLRTRTVDDVLSGVPGVAELVGESLGENGLAAGAKSKVIALNGQSLRLSLLPHRDWDDDNRVSVLIALEELGSHELFEQPEVAAATHAPAVAVSAPPVSTPTIPLGLPAVAWTLSRKSNTFTFLSESIARFVSPAPVAAAEWPFYERIAEQDREAVRAHYDYILRHAPIDSVYSCEFRMSGAAGRWYRETARVETDALHGILTEITERKTLEEHQIQSQRVDALALIAGRVAHDLNKSAILPPLCRRFPVNPPRWIQPPPWICERSCRSPSIV